MDEVEWALRKSNAKKAPSPDGISSAFYTENWETVKNELREVISNMMRKKPNGEQQNQGMIICLPKKDCKNTPEGYRPITLLNIDYKILARIIMQRLRPTLEKLHESQFCSVPGNCIFDAVSTIREAIAQAEITATPLCVLSLDFKEAFNRISHEYLFAVLENYKISRSTINRIKNLYTQATSKVQINP